MCDLYPANENGYMIIEDSEPYPAMCYAWEDDSPNDLLPVIAAGDEEEAMHLIDQGADIFAKEKTHGNSAIHWAAESGLSSVLLRLIDMGEDINRSNKRGETPLVLAVQKKQAKMVKLLLSHGAKLKWPQWLYGGPLDYCLVRQCPDEICIALIDAGADPRSIELTDGFNVLKLAVTAPCSMARTLRCLAQCGHDLDANMTIEEGKSAISLVPEHFTHVRTLLLELGADPSDASVSCDMAAWARDCRKQYETETLNTFRETCPLLPRDMIEHVLMPFLPGFPGVCADFHAPVRKPKNCANQSDRVTCTVTCAARCHEAG